MSEYYLEERPWGWFKVLYETPNCKVKELLVRPGHRLSYQSHAKRHEHWLVTQGQAVVTLNGEEHTLEAGKSIDVPLGTKHRMENRSGEETIFIEVQMGTYFGEDDIVRYSDDYNRMEGVVK